MPRGKKVSHKRPHVARYHLYDTSKEGKNIETESSQPLPWVEIRIVNVSGYDKNLSGDGNVLELNDFINL